MATDSRNRQLYGDDWVDRQVEPDVYPRKHDPYSAGGILQPPYGTPGAGADFQPGPGFDLYKNFVTTPGVRPVAFQRGLSQTQTVTDQASPIQAGTFQCDAIMVSVPSTSNNSTFFGFGPIVSSAGIEVFPGVPQIFRPDNTRELWEIQRVIEAMLAQMSYFVGMNLFGQPLPPIGTFMSPRVVMNAHDYYLVNLTGITQNVATLLFTVPEYQ